MVEDNDKIKEEEFRLHFHQPHNKMLQDILALIKNKFFGFTHYLGRHEKDPGVGSKRKISSLSDTINPMNINVIGDGSYEASFSSDVCIFTTGDRNMFEAVKEGM